MGEALIRGFLSSGVSSSEKICASVRSQERKSTMEGIGLQVGFGFATGYELAVACFPGHVTI